MRRWMNVAGALASMGLLGAFQPSSSPEAALAGIVQVYLGMGLPADWRMLERLPNIRWAALPPTSLEHCLPDGGCFTRQGTATLGDRSATVVATGARTMVLALYVRNRGQPLGESNVIGALAVAGLSPVLARCPVRAGAGGTTWYRLQGKGLSTGYLSVQAATTSRPGEGFVLTFGDSLPPLQPNQLALYSDQCAPGARREPVSTVKPHERLAEVVVALLPAHGSPRDDWTALAARSVGIVWNAGGPQPADLSFQNDPNPLMRSGSATWAGRTFSLMASGTPERVANIYFEEQGTHPRGEHMLGVVYQKGISVQLVRCGPIYTESTNNWYRLTSARTAPVMLRQSIRYDGNLTQDSYVLRLDGTLPPRDPRDRDPGVNGC